MTCSRRCHLNIDNVYLRLRNAFRTRTQRREWRSGVVCLRPLKTVIQFFCFRISRIRCSNRANIIIHNQLCCIELRKPNRTNRNQLSGRRLRRSRDERMPKGPLVICARRSARPRLQNNIAMLLLLPTQSLWLLLLVFRSTLRANCAQAPVRSLQVSRTRTRKLPMIVDVCDVRVFEEGGI